MNTMLRLAVATFTAVVLLSLPAEARNFRWEDVREGYDSTTFTYPSVRLDDGRFYPVHRGDGIDFCRSLGFHGARERRGRFIDSGLARHKGGRWQYTEDGPMIRRVRCF